MKMVGREDGVSRKRRRGEGATTEGLSLARIKDKKLRSKLKHNDKKFKTASMEAARAELLLPAEAGYIETEGAMEETWRLRQEELKKHVDVQTAAKMFELELKELGPYAMDWSANGRHLLLGGRKGHVALLDQLSVEVVKELHLREAIRDVHFLQNETMFAVAQKKYVYIYDKFGLELHCLRQHIDPLKLDFLRYHYLLVSAGRAGWIKWHDVSTGQLVTETNTRRGACQSMRQNPYNAVMHLGHQNGVVTLWSPSSSVPLVSMLCHRGPVNSLAVDKQGRYMATGGMDGQVKIWDLRTYKMLHRYQFVTPPVSLDVSQRGLLAVGFGCHVNVWKDAMSSKAAAPYLRHDVPGSVLDTLRFRPYEDVLGLGHNTGFVSMVVPGAGEPNFDTFEANPFQTTKQRREAEVHTLLDKLQPETIGLDPRQLGNVDKDPKALAKEQQELMHKADARPHKEKNKMRGKNKLHKRLKRRQQNVIDQKMQLLKQKQEELKEAARKEKSEAEREHKSSKAPRALQRFFSCQGVAF